MMPLAQLNLPQNEPNGTNLNTKSTGKNSDDSNSENISTLLIGLIPKADKENSSESKPIPIPAQKSVLLQYNLPVKSLETPNEDPSQSKIEFNNLATQKEKNVCPLLSTNDKKTKVSEESLQIPGPSKKGMSANCPKNMFNLMESQNSNRVSCQNLQKPNTTNRQFFNLEMIDPLKQKNIDVVPLMEAENSPKNDPKLISSSPLAQGPSSENIGTIPEDSAMKYRKNPKIIYKQKYGNYVSKKPDPTESQNSQEAPSSDFKKVYGSYRKFNLALEKLKLNDVPGISGNKDSQKSASNSSNLEFPCTSSSSNTRKLKTKKQKSFETTTIPQKEISPPPVTSLYQKVSQRDTSERIGNVPEDSVIKYRKNPEFGYKQQHRKGKSHLSENTTDPTKSQNPHGVFNFSFPKGNRKNRSSFNWNMKKLKQNPQEVYSTETEKGTRNDSKSISSQFCTNSHQTMARRFSSERIVPVLEDSGIKNWKNLNVRYEQQNGNSKPHLSKELTDPMGSQNRQEAPSRNFKTSHKSNNRIFNCAIEHLKQNNIPRFCLIDEKNENKDLKKLASASSSILESPRASSSSNNRKLKNTEEKSIEPSGILQKEMSVNLSKTSTDQIESQISQELSCLNFPKYNVKNKEFFNLDGVERYKENSEGVCLTESERANKNSPKSNSSKPFSNFCQTLAQKYSSVRIDHVSEDFLIGGIKDTDVNNKQLDGDNRSVLSPKIPNSIESQNTLELSGHSFPKPNLKNRRFIDWDMIRKFQQNQKLRLSEPEIIPETEDVNKNNPKSTSYSRVITLHEGRLLVTINNVFEDEKENDPKSFRLTLAETLSHVVDQENSTKGDDSADDLSGIEPLSPSSYINFDLSRQTIRTIEQLTVNRDEPFRIRVPHKLISSKFRYAQFYDGNQLYLTYIGDNRLGTTYTLCLPVTPSLTNIRKKNLIFQCTVDSLLQLKVQDYRSLPWVDEEERIVGVGLDMNKGEVPAYLKDKPPYAGCSLCGGWHSKLRRNRKVGKFKYVHYERIRRRLFKN